MVRWMRWHCPPDTGFEIRALAVWGRARYLSVTWAPHNTEFYTWMGKKRFCFFQTAETGNRAPNSSVKGSGANHYHRAPVLWLHNSNVMEWFRLHGHESPCWSETALRSQKSLMTLLPTQGCLTSTGVPCPCHSCNMTEWFWLKRT